jgi:hypothetical protein
VFRETFKCHYRCITCCYPKKNVPLARQNFLCFVYLKITVLAACNEACFRPSLSCVIFSQIQHNSCLLPQEVACVFNPMLWPVNCLDMTTMHHALCVNKCGDVYCRASFCTAETTTAECFAGNGVLFVFLTTFPQEHVVFTHSLRGQIMFRNVRS